MLSRIRDVFGAKPAAAVAAASTAPAAPSKAPVFAQVLRAVRDDRRLAPRDYASLAEAVIGGIREEISSGWLLSCWVEESIDHYLRRAGINHQTINRVELRLAIRARADVQYIQKQRIKTDARFDELRALVRAMYRGDEARLRKALGDKVAVYYVAPASAATGPVERRDAPTAGARAGRDARPQTGSHVGHRPGAAAAPVQRAPVSAENDVFGRRKAA